MSNTSQIPTPAFDITGGAGSHATPTQEDHEQARLARLRFTPQQVAALTMQYIADGGDPADITAAMEAVLPAHGDEALADAPRG